MTLTRMIFAVQMTDPKPTRLRVRGNVGTPAPAMTSLRREDSKLTSVDCVDGSWTMDLDAGDYLIEIQVEKWVAGRLDIGTELAPGQRPPIFVDHGSLRRSPSPAGLAIGEAPVLTVDDTKDPWPPPPPPTPTPTVTLAVASAEWFTAQLDAARTRIAAEFAAAGVKYTPASVVDALVTGR